MEKTSMKQLIESTALVTKTTQKQTEETIRAFIGELQLNLAKNRSITILGLGTFKPVHHDARVGHNPATGEKLTIPAHDTIIFKVSKKFKETLNGGK